MKISNNLLDTTEVLKSRNASEVSLKKAADKMPTPPVVLTPLPPREPVHYPPLIVHHNTLLPASFITHFPPRKQDHPPRLTKCINQVRGWGPFWKSLALPVRWPKWYTIPNSYSSIRLYCWTIELSCGDSRPRRYTRGFLGERDVFCWRGPTAWERAPSYFNV